MAEVTNDRNYLETKSKLEDLTLNSEKAVKGESEATISENGVSCSDGKSQGEVEINKARKTPGIIFSATNKDDDCYNMNHKRRGYCLVFNHNEFEPSTELPPRNGTDKDRDNVKDLFKLMGFEVEVYNNLSVREIKFTLENYAENVDHSDCDCFVVVFMSHGEDGNLFGRDGIFKADSLHSGFTAENCPTLAGKPKMFFIQACRGEGLDEGTSLVHRKSADRPDSGAYTIYKIPNHADFLICSSTVSGHYSWRNTTNGSWFIQSLVHVFGGFASSLDVLSMMTRVNRYMALGFESNCPASAKMHKRKQTASVMSTLMRLIYLRPKV